MPHGMSGTDARDDDAEFDRLNDEAWEYGQSIAVPEDDDLTDEEMAEEAKFFPKPEGE
jgi:hypothetical protein